MADQALALRLANALEDDLSELGVWGQDIADSAAAELRRLHALNGELLEALKEIYEWTQYKDTPWAVKARAAIAKAEGEPK